MYIARQNTNRFVPLLRADDLEDSELESSASSSVHEQVQSVGDCSADESDALKALASMRALAAAAAVPRHIWHQTSAERTARLADAIHDSHTRTAPGCLPMLAAKAASSHEPLSAMVLLSFPHGSEGRRCSPPRCCHTTAPTPTNHASCPGRHTQAHAESEACVTIGRETEWGAATGLADAKR